MAKEVETRVVQMKFDNKQFQKNINETLSSLEELDKSLKFEDASKGFDKIAQASRNVSLGVFGDAVDSVKFKFNALEIAAITAITNITNKAINAGERLIKSLSVDNITAGWQKFEDTTTSVGTLISQGFKMEEVEKQLEKLNWFTDETSYNFTDMVNNIGKFTATGQSLEASVDAMQGIANWAALSGANAQKASMAMYQLAQAMGKGALKYDDYKSIQNVNMDTREFRQTALEAAAALGTLKKTADGAYETLKGHKFTIDQFGTYLSSDAWLTSDVMIATFNKYSKDLDKIYAYATEHNMTASDAIRELGNSIDSFGLKAFKAAQEARTWSDVIASVKDAVSSKWKETFELIIGNYEEAKQLFTALANILYDVFASGGDKRNSILEQWKELGGREALLDSFLSILLSIKTVSEAIADVWRKIFLNGADETEEIRNKAEKLFNLTEKLRDGLFKILGFIDANIPNIQSFFGGIFSVIKSVKDVITDIIKAIFPQTNAFHSLSQIIMNLLGAVGKLLTKFAEWIKQAEIVKTVSAAIGKVLSFIGNAILYTIAILSVLGSRVKEIIYRLKQFEPVRKILNLLSTAFYICGAGVMYAIDSIKQFIKVVSTPELAKESDNPIVKALYFIYNGFLKIGQGVLVAIAGIRNFVASLKGLSFVDKLKALFDKIKEVKDNVLGSIFGTAGEGATTLHDKLVLLGQALEPLLKQFTVGKIVALAFTVSMLGVAGAFAKLLNSASSLFGNVTGFFKVLKQVITKTYAKSVGILNIAEAFGILAASLWVLSRIQQQGLLTDTINEVLRLIGVLAGFYVIIVGLNAILKKFKLGDFVTGVNQDFTKIMLSLAAALTAVSLSLVTLQGIHFNGHLLANIILATTIMTVLGTVGLILSRFSSGTITKSIAASIAILALALSLKKIVAAIKDLSDLDSRDVLRMSKALAPMVIAFGALCMGIGQIKIGTVIAAVIVVGLLKKFMPDLIALSEELKKLDFSGLMAKIAQVIVLDRFLTIMTALLLILAVRGNAIKGATKGLSTLLLSIGALLAICAFLSKHNFTISDDILEALAIIGAIIAAIEFLSILTNGAKIIKFAIGMTLLTGTMGIMILLAKAIQKLNITSADLDPLLTIAGAIAILEVMSMFTSKSKVLSLIAIMGGLISLVSLMIALTLIPTEQLIAVAASLTFVFGSIGFLLKQITNIQKFTQSLKGDTVLKTIGNFIGSFIKTALYLGLMLTTLVVVVSQLNKLRGFQWQELLSAGVAISLILDVIGVMIQRIVKVTSKLGGVNIGTILATLAGSALIVYTMSHVIKELGSAMASIMGVGGNIAGAAVAIGGIIAVIGVIVSSIILLSGSKNALANMFGTFMVIISMCPLILSLANAIEKLAEINPDALKRAAWTIGILTSVIAGLGLLLGTIGGGTAGAIGLLLLAAGLTAVGLAMYAYVGAFDRFADSLIKIQNAVVNDPLGTAVTQIKNAIVGLEAEKAAIVQGFYDLGANIVAGFKQGIDDNLAILNSTSQTLAEVPADVVEQYNGIKSPSTRFMAIGGYMIAGLAEGVINGLGMLFGLGETVSNTISEPLIEDAITTGVVVEEVAATTSENVVNIVDEEVPKVAEIAQETEKALIADQETADSALEAETKNTTEKQKSFWSQMWDSIKVKAQQALNSIFGWISGSNEYAKEVNAELQKGLDEGWQDWTTEKVWSTVKGVGEKVGIDLNKGLDIGGLLTTAKDKVAEYKKELGFGADSIFDTSALDEYTSGLEGLADSYGTVSGAAGTAKSAFDSLKDSISSQMDIFSEFNDSADISAQQMLDNMKSQIFGINEWSNNLARLAMRGLDAGLLQQLGDLGPQGYAKVAAFAQMTDEQLQEANFLYATAMKLPGYAADEVASSYRYAGEMAIKGYSNALDRYKGLINTAEIGETSITELSTAINQYTSSTLVPQATSTSKQTKAALGSNLTAKDGAEISTNVINGMVAGMTAVTENAKLIAAAKGVSKIVNKTYKDSQQIKSPSRVWARFGENMVLGLVNGIDTTRIKAEESVELVANAVNAAMDIIETDPQFQPVMTPILNLSEIQNGVGLMDSMMSTASVGITAQKYDEAMQANRAAQTQANYYKSVNDTINKGVAEVVGAIMATDQPVNVNVTLQGDSAGIFKMVRSETNKFTKINGYNPLTY